MAQALRATITALHSAKRWADHAGPSTVPADIRAAQVARLAAQETALRDYFKTTEPWAHERDNTLRMLRYTEGSIAIGRTPDPAAARANLAALQARLAELYAERAEYERNRADAR